MSEITKDYAATFLEGWRCAIIEREGGASPLICQVMETAIESLLEEEKAEPEKEEVVEEAVAMWIHGVPTNKRKFCSNCNSERPAVRINGKYYMWDSPHCPSCGFKMKGE